MQKFKYARHGSPETLIEFLCRRFQYKNDDAWRESTQNGEVQVNRNPINPEYILQNRDVVSYERPQAEEPQIDTTHRLLYEDHDILVVEKSGNIPVSESGQYRQNTLLGILKKNYDYPELYAVHRLDRETSGVLVIAKTKANAQILGKAFYASQPQKTYHAVVIGNFGEQERMVDFPIMRNPDKEGIRIRQKALLQGKPSKTLFIPKKTDDWTTLCEIQTFTGRTHQIRCHAEYIGYPILGDKLYGQTDEFFMKVIKRQTKPIFLPFGEIFRQLLHASFLKFEHPVLKREIEFYSDCSPFFEQFPVTRSLLN